MSDIRHPPMLYWHFLGNDGFRHPRVYAKAGAQNGLLPCHETEALPTYTGLERCAIVISKGVIAKLTIAARQKPSAMRSRELVMGTSTKAIRKRALC